MTVTLYKNTSDKRNLNKVIFEIKSVSATAKGEINIISPTLILEYFSTDFNYCYISDFNRYYFVKSITFCTVSEKRGILLSVKKVGSIFS